MCVLVLEDEAGIRNLLTEILDEEGWPVWQASSLAEARQCLCNHETKVVIADHDLGAGENGHAFAADARTKRPYLAVIYMTGLHIHLNGVVLRDGEWTLPKPFLPSTLAHLVRTALSR